MKILLIVGFALFGLNRVAQALDPVSMLANSEVAGLEINPEAFFIPDDTLLTPEELNEELAAERSEEIEAEKDNALAALTPASDILDSVGSRLGKTHKGFPFNRPAFRLYLDPVVGEPGNYHAVLFQYKNLLRIFPPFLAARVGPGLSKVMGYLKHIGSEIKVFKVSPTANNWQFEMKPLKVSGKEIVPDEDAQVSILELAKKVRPEDPLGGARILVNGEKRYSFPRESKWPKGLQYDLMRTTYSLAKIDSTWRKSFLPGPYLAAYKKIDDVVLTLSTESGNESMATFSSDPKFDKVRPKRRFTNPKSAHIRGQFVSSMPKPGMFILSPTSNGEQKGAEHLEGRIGLFIDVFDATRNGEDVVELAFINPNNPKDFLMYFEHPDNGEGKP